MPHPLDPLLRPRSIALVGASERVGSPGRVLAELIANSGFGGRVYPVNPGYESILGLPCHADLDALPETVDHAVLAVSNERLEPALAGVIEHGARAATIYSSCVLEHDGSPPLRTRLESMAKDAGIAVCGGNCMGFYNPVEHLYAGIFPMPGALVPGNVTVIAQSGSAFTALAHGRGGLKFNLCVSCGSELSTTVADYMDWSLDQDETRVIALFLETVRDPQGFIKALGKARARDIPVVMLKVGKSPLGAEMAATHTGAISGNHAAYEALASRYGIIEVGDFPEMLAMLQLLQSPRRAGPGGLATIFESGGLMELVTDIAWQLDLPFAPLEEATKARIQDNLDPGLRAGNPLDAWGSNTDFENRFHRCLSAMMQDHNVAAGMFVTNFRDGYYLSEAFFRVVEKVCRETAKPLSMTNSHGDLANDNLGRRCREAGIPFIDGIREGLVAIRHLFAYRDFRARTGDEREITAPDADTVDRWRRRLGEAADRSLGEFEALRLLEDFGIGVPPLEKIDDESSLVAAADRVGYPVALKTAAPGISHKSDHGGVRIDIRDRETLLTEYRRLRAALGPAALVCRMVDPGTEIGLGMINDPQFGPVIMVSSGGVLIELVKDRAVALAPVDHDEAEALVGSISSDALLRGARGRAVAHRQALIDMIVTFSAMCHALADQVAEIDVNPVIVNRHQAVAVDALVVTCRPGSR